MLLGEGCRLLVLFRRRARNAVLDFRACSSSLAERCQLPACSPESLASGKSGGKLAGLSGIVPFEGGAGLVHIR